MKRKYRAISGPGVRYYEHTSGIVNAKKPRLVRIVLPMITTFLLLGGVGYYAVNQYLYKQPVLLSNNAPAPAPAKAEPEQDSPDLIPYQAREDKQLTADIQSKIDSMPAGTEWAVSVRDLKTGRMANINANQKMETASFYKMFLLAPLEKRLSADYWASWYGAHPIKDCVALMISVSDNDCAKMLAQYAGWDTVDPLDRELGFTNTTIGGKDGNKTTSKDMSELMYRLQNSMMLSDKARRIVFDALYDQKLRDGIPAGCGSQCLVGNKTGELDGVKHDAAVVTHGDAHYIVVIMSTGNATWSQVADIAHSVDELMLP